jgi:hypothetical protein
MTQNQTIQTLVLEKRKIERKSEAKTPNSSELLKILYGTKFGERVMSLSS